MNTDKIVNLIAASRGTESEAYDAGYDCGMNGANTTNCHFRHFGSKERMQEWERGKRDGDAAKAGAKARSKR